MIIIVHDFAWIFRGKSCLYLEHCPILPGVRASKKNINPAAFTITVKSKLQRSSHLERSSGQKSQWSISIISYFWKSEVRYSLGFLQLCKVDQPGDFLLEIDSSCAHRSWAKIESETADPRFLMGQLNGVTMGQ